MKERLLVILLLVSLGFSCRNSKTKTSEFAFSKTDSIPASEAEKLSPEAIADISKNISSPLEIANLLQILQVPFSQDYLAGMTQNNNQSTDFDKALKLGILGADLGYLNMYEKTGSSLEVLSSIRKIAGEIEVGQFFDFETLKRLSKNKSNLDSLLFLSIDSYNKIDGYLRSNDRGQLSALMIIGVWIEGQYLATQVVKRFPNKMLSDRIGEQKIILNDLLLLISPYCNKNPEVASLCRDMQAIKDKYRDIRITYTPGDPISVEKDGGLTIKQTETSVVTMSEEQLTNIIETTRDIRDRLILNK
jgi:hypothetical protein